MLKIITSFFDILFPPRECELRARSITSTDILSVYSPHALKDTIFLTSYQDPIVKILITENKFHQNRHSSMLLAQLIEYWLLQKQLKAVILIPIPLGKRRQRERGYNQVTEILKQLPSSLATIEPSLLKRTRDTKSQTQLTREERLKNMIGAFTCDKEKLSKLEHATVIIVDDVLTTGATFAAARAALAPHLHPSNKLICLAIAH